MFVTIFIFKKSNREGVNYRPVSLTRIVCKLLEERITKNLLIGWYDRLKKKNNGSKRKTSCTSLLHSYEPFRNILERQTVDGLCIRGLPEGS